MTQLTVPMPFVSELATRYRQVRESADCGFMPASWQAVMQAIVDGIYTDSRQNRRLLAECAAIADGAAIALRKPTVETVLPDGGREQTIDSTPLWSEVVDIYIDDLTQLDQQAMTKRAKQRKTAAGEQLVNCGKVADAWLAKQQPATN